MDNQRISQAAGWRNAGASSGKRGTNGILMMQPEPQLAISSPPMVGMQRGGITRLRW